MKINNEPDTGVGTSLRLNRPSKIGRNRIREDAELCFAVSVWENLWTE